VSEINKRLSEIQHGLHAGKEQQNSFGKYNYRSAESIMQALKPLLGDASVVLTDSIEHIGNRHYVKARATISLAGEILFAEAFARECDHKKGMDDAQLTGSCSSYARKYALCGLFLIDDNKDIDSIDNANQPSERQCDLDAACFETLLNQKDLDGIVGFWDQLKPDRARAGAAWQLLSDEIKLIIN